MVFASALETESVVTGSVLVLGGYGNFGKRIAARLIQYDVPVIVAGRSLDKAEAEVRALNSKLAKAAAFDAMQDLGTQLQALRPLVVVNTVGPFQTSDYRVARASIAHGVHYVDLADGRDFVTGIVALNEDAKRAGVSVIAGASTVPGLSSAVIEHYAGEFAEIDELVYGISPGQKAERGLATTQGILTYVGKRLRPFAGVKSPVYGWQDLYRQDYPELGRRWMANCDIPDLDLLPPRYGIKSIRFSAGLELSPLHLGLWGLGWLVRLGVPLDLPRHAGLDVEAQQSVQRFRQRRWRHAHDLARTRQRWRSAGAALVHRGEGRRWATDPVRAGDSARAQFGAGRRDGPRRLCLRRARQPRGLFARATRLSHREWL